MAMVLHLIPVPEDGDVLADFQEDIMVLPDEPAPKPPRIHEWRAENKEQTITHIATGLQFRAFPVKQPLVGGLVLPFHKPYEVAVRLVGIPSESTLPSRERLREIARQGVMWIKTYTYESSRR
jgi:hypothetical protein